MSRNTLYKIVNRTAAELIHSNELTRILQPEYYSGIVILDGKYTAVKDIPELGHHGHVVIMPFMDYWTHDIPIYIIALSENQYDVEQGFKELKELEYDLKVLVCDEHMYEMAKDAVKKYYPEVIIQICLKHYSDTIDRTLKVKKAKQKKTSLEKKLKDMENSFFIATHHYDISKAIELVNEIADLEHKYAYLIETKDLFHEVLFGANNEEELTTCEDQLNEILSHMVLNKYPYKKEY